MSNDEPVTPDEDIPQDPGTSGLPSEEQRAAPSPEQPDPREDEPGTDAAGRGARHRSDEQP